MCHLSLQSGGPTASGDSDKSKSEVNDEDEEVRESKASWVLPACSCVSTAGFTLWIPNLTRPVHLNLVLQGDE